MRVPRWGVAEADYGTRGRENQNEPKSSRNFNSLGFRARRFRRGGGGSGPGAVRGDRLYRPGRAAWCSTRGRGGRLGPRTGVLGDRRQVGNHTVILPFSCTLDRQLEEEPQ